MIHQPTDSDTGGGLCSVIPTASGYCIGCELKTSDCKMTDGSWRRGGAPQMTFTDADLDAADQDSSGTFKEIPDGAAQYLTYFYKKFLERNVPELHSLYESTFSDLTNRYFKSSKWPSPEAVSPLVDSDSTFLLLYKELYYRHLFSKMQPTLAQRVDSWTNYFELFDCFIKDGFIDYDLPPSWLWDMVDEFIYQFETWCQYRAKLKSKSPGEIEYFRENDYIWNVQAVLQMLHVLVHKSNIISWLLQGGASSGSSDPDDESFDISTLPVYRYIGYFSIIGLLRVNTLLGDYKLALMVLQPLDFNITSALFTHVTACHVSINYYMGFCYIMLRRYEDAVRVFSSTVVHVGRIKHNHTRSYQYEQINKRNDQMMALLALCLALRPQQVDESVYTLVRDKAGDRLARMRQGEMNAFEDLFNYASPKFISPAPPDYDTIADTNMDAPRHQTRMFMREVDHQRALPDIRSYLKLYTTIEIEKLASLTDVDEATLRSHLHALKHKSWAQCGSFQGAPLDGKYTTSSDVGFHIENDVIHISDTKSTARFGEYFIEQIGKLDDLLDQFKRKFAAHPSGNVQPYRRTARFA